MEFKGTLNLKNASIKSKAPPLDISAINGVINFNQETINWSNLNLNLFSENFKSKATISNLKSPLISLELKGKNLSLSTKIEPIGKNNFNIEYIKADYYNSGFNLSGRLNLEDKEIFNVNLDILSQIQLQDLKQIKNLKQENIAKINSRPARWVAADALRELRSDAVRKRLERKKRK